MKESLKPGIEHEFRISRGTHERFVIDAERFNERVRHKAASAR